MRFPWLSCCLLFAVASSGCEKDNGLVDPDNEAGRVYLLELIFHDIGTPNMRASVLVARDVPDLEKVRALGVGDSTVTFHLIAAGVLDVTVAGADRRRLVHAIFRVDNLLDTSVAARDVILVGVGRSDTDLNKLVRPTGMARFDENGEVKVDSVNVLRVLTTDETRGLVRPSGITHVFDFGFVVRPNGLVTFAFSLPLTNTQQDNISTLSLLLMSASIPN